LGHLHALADGFTSSGFGQLQLDFASLVRGNQLCALDQIRDKAGAFASH
jgi:hypothetical protein